MGKAGQAVKEMENMGQRAGEPGVSTFCLEKQRALCSGTGRVNLIVKLLPGFTCSYPCMVQGARGSVGQLALGLYSN